MRLAALTLRRFRRALDIVLHRVATSGAAVPPRHMRLPPAGGGAPAKRHPERVGTTLRRLLPQAHPNALIAARRA